jgi:hypothetical protein
MIRKFTRSSLLFACCLVVFTGYCNAQSSNISIALIGYTIDTVNLGYTLTMNAEVTNQDSVPFTGRINFGLRSNNDIITNSTVFDQPPYSGDSIYLNGHETVPAVFGVNINPQYFTPGPDVVVVWPICTAPNVDSIVLHIFVQDPSGINGPAAGLFAYHIQADKILFSNGQANTVFEQVRIFDVAGRQVIAQNGTNITEVPIGRLLQGVYVCQLICGNGLKINFKFVAP